MWYKSITFIFVRTELYISCNYKPKTNKRNANWNEWNEWAEKKQQRDTDINEMDVFCVLVIWFSLVRTAADIRTHLQLRSEQTMAPNGSWIGPNNSNNILLNYVTDSIFMHVNGKMWQCPISLWLCAKRIRLRRSHKYWMNLSINLK